jgi:hypothetical protein
MASTALRLSGGLYGTPAPGDNRWIAKIALESLDPVSAWMIANY